MSLHAEGDQAGGMLDAWLAEAWRQSPETFLVDGDDGVPLACRGWNMAAVDRPTLLFVHGFRAHARWWDHIAPHFAQDNRVLAFDLSGMGDSGYRTCYSRIAHSRDILAIIRGANLDRPTLVAHSYGGQAALLAAVAAPSRIDRVIMIDSKIPLARDSTAIRAYPGRPYPSLEAGLARFRLTPVSHKPVPAVLDHIARHSLRKRDGGWCWKVDAAITDNFDNATCRELMMGQSVPIDMIFGEASRIVTEERLATLRAMAPSLGTPVGIPFANHHIMLEEPVALVCAIRGLLARTQHASQSAGKG